MSGQPVPIPSKLAIDIKQEVKPLVNGNGQHGASNVMSNFAKIASTDQKTTVNTSVISTHPTTGGNVTIIPQINTNVASIAASNGTQHVPIVSVANTSTMNMVRPNQQIIRMPHGPNPGQPLIIQRPPVQGAITLPQGMHLPAGTILMQNEKGQIVFMQRSPNGQPVAVGAPGSAHHMIAQRPIIPHSRHQRPINARPIHPLQHQMNTQDSSGQVLIKPSPGTDPRPAPPTRQLLPATDKAVPTPAQSRVDEITKCKNFLETLIRLSSQQPQQTLENVKKLIQGLLDNTVQPDVFTAQLQKELKSNKQPGLATFLKKSLPELRNAISRKELTIEGLGVKYQPTVINNMHQPPNMVNMPQQQINQQTHIRHQITTIGQRPPSHQARPNVTQIRQFTPKQPAMTLPPTSQQKTPAGSRVQTGKQHLDLKDDDDINDVATMGGVNLSEETKNLAIPSDSTQLRSCRDEILLSSTPLANKIRQLASKRGMRDVSNDVISLISHACEERLRGLSEQCTLTAEHRLDIYKVDSRYEASHDVRSQIKFLEDLDKLEKKRHEDQEREMLHKAAKSRSKTEDPEQAKLKLKAKEMKEAEQEELRQRDANLTALAAIGPRKKRRYEDLAAGSSISGNSSSPINSTVYNRPRLKRVNLRDLQTVLEQDSNFCKSHTLYKAFLR